MFSRLTVISPPLLELGDEFWQVGAELCKVDLSGLVKIHVRVGGVRVMDRSGIGTRVSCRLVWG